MAQLMATETYMTIEEMKCALRKRFLNFLSRRKVKFDRELARKAEEMNSFEDSDSLEKFNQWKREKIVRFLRHMRKAKEMYAFRLFKISQISPYSPREADVSVAEREISTPSQIGQQIMEIPARVSQVFSDVVGSIAPSKNTLNIIKCGFVFNSVFVPTFAMNEEDNPDSEIQTMKIAFNNWKNLGRPNAQDGNIFATLQLNRGRELMFQNITKEWNPLNGSHSPFADASNPDLEPGRELEFKKTFRETMKKFGRLCSGGTKKSKSKEVKKKENSANDNLSTWKEFNLRQLCVQSARM
jgi:hypothetical protein